MEYDEFQCKCSFWSIDIPLFIKLICEHTSSVVYNISFFDYLWFGLNNDEKAQQNPFIKNLAGKVFCNISVTAGNAYNINRV